MATSRGGRPAQMQREQQVEMHSLTSRETLESLDQKYKPIFYGYAEDGGIPLQVLRIRLQSEDTGDLPSDKLNALWSTADAGGNGILKYDEFVQLMTTTESADVPIQHFTKFQLLVKYAVSTVIPDNQIAQDGDYADNYNCRPPPLFMITISVVELVIFIAYAIVQKDKGIPTTMTSGAPLETPLVYNPYRRYEAWRFLSYMFIHDGIKHIISNLIFQLLIGIPLELAHKFWRVGIVYCLGVIAGSLGTSVFDPRTFLVGASGGCYALIGGHLATVIMNWQDMNHDWMSGPIKFLLSAPVCLAFWTIYAGVDTAVAIYTRYTQPEGSRVAYVAHFAGLVAGILIGIPVLKNFHVKPWETILWWIALVVYFVLVLFAVCWNGFYPNYYPPTDWRPCCPCPYGYRCPQ